MWARNDGSGTFAVVPKCAETFVLMTFVFFRFPYDCEADARPLRFTVATPS